MIFALDTNIVAYALIKRRNNFADILIAAFCIINGYTLVTNNEKHFRDIEELDYTNWVEK